MSKWTVAYRRVAPEAEPVFHRVDLELDWQESVELAGQYVAALGEDYEVWYTSTRASELDGCVALEDVLNILVVDDQRVPIADDGLTLDALR